MVSVKGASLHVVDKKKVSCFFAPHARIRSQSSSAEPDRGGHSESNISRSSRMPESIRSCSGISNSVDTRCQLPSRIHHPYFADAGIHPVMLRNTKLCGYDVRF
ncbi:hypothetical protein TGAM01_v205642 [Trichoderma gamsii]|uniref:Uncharacterized protein n=1 Tax=Trichoderma gamsii TaxID=398673 RepID=A0A2P4ZM37_9HYPO|nr:hypothetical protein TGAM01_v205642 [Trichoderma gamsii]PON25348.1 hypothetical protein TGAM01_v205642 [Trichoderma gamsii]